MNNAIQIPGNKFPEHAKILGSKLLSYVLNLDVAQVETLMSKGGELDIARYNALSDLDSIMLEVKKNRINNSVLELSDRLTLSSIQYRDRSFLFQKLRDQIANIPIELGGIEDSVIAALAPICIASFPFTLIPQGREGAVFDHFNLPHFFATPEAEAFHQAVLQDKELIKLFHTVSGDAIETRGYVYTSLDSGGSIQLAMMWVQILHSANALMRLDNDQSPERFLAAASEVVASLKQAIAGQPSKTVGVLFFDGVGFPDNFEVKMSSGVLKAIPDSATELIPSSARPPTVGNRPAGVMLVFKVDYRIFITDKEYKCSFDGGWPIESSLNSIDTMINEVSLVTALAFGREAPAAARYISSLFVNPILYSSVSWRQRASSHREYVIADDAQCAEITKWAEFTKKVSNQKIEVAIRRYLSAITERSDMADSLVDAVIGLENLFGQRTGIGLAIASSVARLLGAEESQREEIFGKVKKIYTARSDIVHGSKKRKPEEIIELRNRAIRYLSDCLRVLYEKHPKLLTLSSDNRVKKIMLSEMTMSKPMLEVVWGRIKLLEGKGFHTKTGKPFTFEIAGDVFQPSRTTYNVSKADFGKALELVPFDGPGMVNDMVRGPSYIWAVLHDARVRRQDW